MKKSVSMFLLSLASVVSFAFGAASCNPEEPSESTGGSSSGGGTSVQIPGGNLVVPEEPGELTAPNLKNITVYKEDSPEGFYVGNGKLLTLTVGGTVLEEDDYVISGGWLVLKANNWAEIGSGEVSFAFDFENHDDVTITVTISDTDDTPAIPGDELTSEANFELWKANSSYVSLSYENGENAIVVTKTSDKDSVNAKENMVYLNADYIRLAKENGATCIQFDYKANDALVSGENAAFRFYATEAVVSLTGAFDIFTVSNDWQTATIDIEQFFVANEHVQYFGIVLGGGANSSLTIKNWRIGTTEDLNVYRSLSLIPNYGFFEENVAKWTSVNTAGIKLGWDSDLGMMLTPQMANAGLWQRYCMVYTPVTFMRIAQSAGYEGISFTVKTDEGFENYEPGIANGVPLGKGLRVVSKMKDGADDNRIVDGYATGIYQYADFGGEPGISEFTVTIALDDFFALNEDVKYLGLTVGTPLGGSLYLSDLKLLESVEGLAPKPVDPAVELSNKYGFTENNIAQWETTSNASVFAKEWDETEGAMKVSMVNANANINGRYFVTYTGIDVLKDAQEAGFDIVTFKVTSSDGAFAPEGKGLRIYSKQNQGLDGAGIDDADASKEKGIYVYRDFGTAADTTEFTVKIDIAKFLALNENANYIGVVLAMAGGTTAYFSDMEFVKYATAEELNEEYGFTAENNANWNVTSNASVFAKEWDETAGAMKVSMVNANANINGRYYVTYTSIDVLKAAQEANFDIVTFKVTSSDGAFAPEGKGLRIYSKQNNGLDGAAIDDADASKEKGIYIYGDFGTAADTTEFIVKIKIKEFLALNENANYIGVVLAMAGGTTAYFSDMQFVKYPTAKELAAEYGFTAENDANWNVTSNASVFAKEWDETAGAMKVSMVNTSANINGRYYVTYTSIEMLKAAQEAGFDMVTFKVTSADGAFTAEGKGLRIYSKQNNGLDGAAIDDADASKEKGIYVYGDFGTAADTTEFIVKIKIDEFLALNENANYIGVVLAMAGGTTAYFSDMQFVKYPTAKELAAEYGFTAENDANWNVTSPASVFAKEWDETAGAMKVSMVNASAAINGRYYVTYTSIEMLKAAQEAGFKTVTFKVTSSDGAFTAEGKGLRIYSKQNNGLDTAGIDDADASKEKGIYVYGDFGTEADTTEFTVTINIDEFLALNENANYVGVVLAMAGGTTAYFSDMQFLNN